MLRTRVFSSLLAAVSILPLLSCGANVCFQGSSPQIRSVTPSTVPAGSSSVQVTVLGSNFSDGTMLVFDDGTQLSPTSTSSTQINFSFSATFFNGVGTIRFHLQDGCRGA